MTSHTLILERPVVPIQHRRRALYFSAMGNLAGDAPSPVELIDSIQAHPHRLGVLDLRCANALTTSDLEWLEQASALADAHGVRLRIVTKVNSPVHRIIRLLHFDRFLVVASSIRDALKFPSPIFQSAT